MCPPQSSSTSSGLLITLLPSWDTAFPASPWRRRRHPAQRWRGATSGKERGYDSSTTVSRRCGSICHRATTQGKRWALNCIDLVYDYYNLIFKKKLTRMVMCRLVRTIGTTRLIACIISKFHYRNVFRFTVAYTFLTYLKSDIKYLIKGKELCLHLHRKEIIIGKFELFFVRKRYFAATFSIYLQ